MSFKEDAVVSEWKSMLIEKSEEHNIKGEYAKDCEYNDVCRYTKNQCIVNKRGDCYQWHIWKKVDLEMLFGEKKKKDRDENRNYLLDF